MLHYIKNWAFMQIKTGKIGNVIDKLFNEISYLCHSNHVKELPF